MLNKIKRSEIPAVRNYLLEQQDHCCALCNDTIEEGKAVLDHDHRSGIIRRVLHRGCNAMLGKIENNMARNQITMSRLQGMANGVHDYINNTTSLWIHPSFLTKEERRMKAYKKKRKAPKPKKRY